MPELPEVETTRKGISDIICGATIISSTVRQAKLRFPVNSDFSKKVINQTILDIQRRAKYLILKLTQGNILIHLGMSGHLSLIQKQSPVNKHAHVDIHLDNGYILRYTDPRRFGIVQWFDDNIEAHPLLKHLGPEPLSAQFTGKSLWEKSQQRRISIKQFIMDNKIIVGVGNIYACESLFLSGIHPNKPANTLSLEQYKNLANIIKTVLRKAIKQGGTTLKDFYNADGKPGYFSQSLYVYGRENDACYQCQTPIKTLVIGQRNSYYCPQCQQ